MQALTQDKYNKFLPGGKINENFYIIIIIMMIYGNFCRFERMQSKYSPEDELFINHRHDLIKTLTKNPWEIANTLLMEGLISLTVMHKIKIQVYTHSYKASLLVKGLQEKLRGCDPQMFHQLLDILSTYGLSEALVSNLRKCHHARGKVVREYMPGILH